MSWKSKLGLDTIIKDSEVLEYLKGMGFEEGEFSPIYYNEDAAIHRAETLGSKCLVMSGKELHSYGSYYKIYINDREAYVERFGDVFDGSNLVQFDEELTMKNVDEHLDELI